MKKTEKIKIKPKDIFDLKITILYDYFFRKLTNELLQSIKDTAPCAVFYEVEQSVVKASDLIDSDIVFGRIPPHLLIELKDLKWMHLGSAGANGLTDISLYANKSTLVTKSSGTFGIVIAEYIVGMMIALGKNLGYYYDKKREGIWCDQWPELLSIHGSTVLVLGLGNIGTEVCKMLTSFRCNIIGFRRNATKPHKVISDVRPLSRLRESLPEADYVVICTPGTTETEKLFGDEEFDLMKKRAIIVNVGRGMIIDNDALAKALHERKIAGAGLDVTEPEPLPAGHPLWRCKNLLITPHISAATRLTDERRVMVFIDLLKRYLSGGEMYNIVDFNAGY